MVVKKVTTQKGVKYNVTDRGWGPLWVLGIIHTEAFVIWQTDYQIGSRWSQIQQNSFINFNINHKTDRSISVLLWEEYLFYFWAGFIEILNSTQGYLPYSRDFQIAATAPPLDWMKSFPDPGSPTNQPTDAVLSCSILHYK